jgi:hypothetical protein
MSKLEVFNILQELIDKKVGYATEKEKDLARKRYKDAGEELAKELFRLRQIESDYYEMLERS